jgi:hypothetical protein
MILNKEVVVDIKTVEINGFGMVYVCVYLSQPIQMKWLSLFLVT